MKNEPLENRRYLAAYLPLLSAERIKRQSGKPPESPYALIEKRKGALVLVACDAGALSLGLAPGLSLADARARVPELTVFPHDPDADRALLDWLVDGCGRYTPVVAIDPPDGLLLDITGCSHIRGGEADLANDLRAKLARSGLTCRIELAETPDQARALVRHGNFGSEQSRDVRQLPVRALDLDPDRLNALRRAGLMTLGDLAARPRRPLAARLGMDAMARLERVLGTQDVRVNPRRHVPALVFTRRFAEPVMHSELILVALRELAFEANESLRERSEGGRRFMVSLYRSDGDVRRLSIDTGIASRDPALVIRLFRERIDSLADPLDPGFGYDAMRLDITVTEELASVQDGFGGEGAAASGIANFLDQLTTRLGAARLRRFVAGDSHIPERASTSLPINQKVPYSVWPEPEDGEPPLRPLHLFDPPQRIDISLAQVPDGPPKGFIWRRERRNIILAEGPERISPEWWRRKAGFVFGQAGLTRDYFRVEDDRGHRYWLFRNGLYSETKSPDWYLHGLFA
jgi:protein ImuB